MHVYGIMFAYSGRTSMYVSIGCGCRHMRMRMFMYWHAIDRACIFSMCENVCVCILDVDLCISTCTRLCIRGCIGCSSSRASIALSSHAYSRFIALMSLHCNTLQHTSLTLQHTCKRNGLPTKFGWNSNIAKQRRVGSLEYQ